jgi:hypothetical protein
MAWGFFSILPHPQCIFVFFFGVLVYVYEGHNVFLVFLLAHVNLAHKNSSNTCIVTAVARQDIDVLAVVLTGVYVAKRR